MIATPMMRTGIHVRCRPERRAARGSKKVGTHVSQFFADIRIKIPPPQAQYGSKNKLNNQHQQRVAHCVQVAVHVRVDGLLGCSGNPQRLSVRGLGDGSFAG